MVIDELVSLIRFDMPATSKTALGGIQKTIGKITDSMKSLGIVSAVTSSIFAAFSVNAAKEATGLANLSKSTGVAVGEIEALSAVYEKLGGSAKNFAQDADAFKKMTGKSLNIEEMIKLSETFVGLSDDMAFRFGRAHGFTDDMIRTLQKGPNELRKMADEAKKYNTTNEDSLKNLKALDTAWVDLKEIISPVAKEVQAAFAPVLGGGLTWLSNLLKENKDSIRETMNAIGESVKSAFDLIGGYAEKGWAFAKPYLIDGWGTVKTAASDAWDFIQPILSSYSETWKSVYTAISELDFKGIHNSLKPSDETIAVIRESFGGIRDSIVGVYENIKKSVDDGAIGKMLESLKSIANSEVVKGIKDIGEAFAKFSWSSLEAVFKGLEAAAGAVLPVLEGLLGIVDGLVNADFDKALVGFMKIGDALKKMMTEIIDEVLITIGLKKDDSAAKAERKQLVAMSNDESVIARERDRIMQDSKSIFGFGGKSFGQADNEARKWFNETHLMRRFDGAHNMNPSGAPAVPGGGDTMNSTNNTTFNQTTNITYQVGTPTPLGQIAKDTGLLSNQRMVMP